MKRVGYLGTCGTEYCGSIEGYFCVVCRHYCTDCLCHDNRWGCWCPSDIGWASTGERKDTERRVSAYLWLGATRETALRLRTIALLPRNTAKQRVEARKALYELSWAIHEAKVKKEQFEDLSEIEDFTVGDKEFDW